MTRFDHSAVEFLVLDTLCAHADEMPPKGGATFVDQMTATVAGSADLAGASIFSGSNLSDNITERALNVCDGMNFH